MPERRESPWLPRRWPDPGIRRGVPTRDPPTGVARPRRGRLTTRYGITTPCVAAFTIAVGAPFPVASAWLSVETNVPLG